MVIEKQKECQISKLKDKVSITLICIHNKNYSQLVSMYETKPDYKNSTSIGYDRENIIKDAKSIYQYYNMGNNTDRQLTIAVLATMFHITHENIKTKLSYIGYENIQDTEIYTVSASIRTLRTILDFNEANIKKYSIDTCGDGRVCKKCQSLQGKKFLTSKAKIGINAPPLCDSCRCRMKPIFDYK